MQQDGAFVVTDEAAAGGDTEPERDTLVLAEHSESEPLTISQEDQSFLDTVATDTGAISVRYTADGGVVVETSSYVGLTSLPSGRRIEITPKETVSRLLDLLQYAMDVPSRTVTHETGLTEAHTFIDAFGSLYATKLAEVLQAGIRRDYRRVQAVESSVRGRLDVQRQLQRPTPVPTDFAVEYDTLTANTVVNQGILAATTLLTSLVSDPGIARKLDRQSKQLQQLIEPALVTARDLRQTDLSRLETRYEDILELATLVLARRFFEDITGGELSTFSLFIDMNQIFEAVVDRAFREATKRIDPSWTVTRHGSLTPLIQGPHAVGMEPDIVVQNGSGDVILVVDAKWKTGSESASDVYQLTSYMLADSAPGVLVYPEHDRELTVSTVTAADHELRLASAQLPTAHIEESGNDYITGLVDSAETVLRDALR